MELIGMQPFRCTLCPGPQNGDPRCACHMPSHKMQQAYARAATALRAAGYIVTPPPVAANEGR